MKNERDKTRDKFLEEICYEISAFLNGLISDEEYKNKIAYLNYNFIADIRNLDEKSR